MVSEGEAAEGRSDVDTSIVNDVVVVLAQGDAIDLIGLPVARPPREVVHLAPGGPQRATGPLTMPVADQDRSPRVLHKGPLGSPEVDRSAGGVQNDSLGECVTGKCVESGERKERSVE